MKSDSMDSVGYSANQSPLVMLSGIAERYECLMAKKGKAYKLQAGSRRILSCLNEKDGVSQLDLVHAARLKAPTVSLIVQKMEHDGLISRRTDEIDMRITRVYLTDLGRDVCKKYREAQTEIESAALSCLSAKEAEQFTSCLVRIYSAMDTLDT